MAHVEPVRSRARGLRLAATFAARRRDTKLVYACADATASWASRFGSADARGARPRARRGCAARGRATSAAEQFGLALERLAEVEAPFERALTQARAGAALIAAGERELGVEWLTGAYHTFRKLGARPSRTAPPPISRRQASGSTSASAAGPPATWSRAA